MDIDKDRIELIAKVVAQMERDENVPHTQGAQPPKAKMDFAEKFLIFSALLYGATWIVVMAYLFLYGELLVELIQWSSILFGMEGIGYYATACSKSYARKRGED